MYEDLIEQMNPKPHFILTWYKNEDFYSEGDIEDTIIKLIAQNPPEDYSKAIAKHYCWSTYYHLTNVRQNILNWYPFKEDSSVLEIGCGMGAITGMLCDKAASVTAVEMSKRRATATLIRCREKENLEIIVGNLNDIEFDKKFDYITLIGVLEYQGSYTDTDNPYGDFLKKIRGLLKPDGKLLVAIENQYGLKYWCGAREDHTGLPFDGMNQYTLSNKKVRTFSKAALDVLLRDSGFSETYFYYPMPDYKLPNAVYSQDCLPKDSNMPGVGYYYMPDAHTLVADEKNIYDDIIKNNVFEFFSNSFLVECSGERGLGEITFAAMNSYRYPEYQTGTKFTRNGTVQKFSICGDKVGAHLKGILDNEKDLKSRGLSVLESRRCSLDNTLESDFADMPLLDDVLTDAYKSNDIDKIYSLLDKVYADILKSSDEVSYEKNVLCALDRQLSPDKEKYGAVLANGYVDMIFRNVFYRDGELLWFDQEWKLENVPAKYILFCCILVFYNDHPEADKVLPYVKVLERYGLIDARNDFIRFNDLFINSVSDKLLRDESSGVMADVKKATAESLQRLLHV